MAYQGIQDGVYLAKRPAYKMGGLVDHYGVIEIGNVLKLVESDLRRPVVYHLVPARGLVYEYCLDEWKIIEQVAKENFETTRLRILEKFQSPEYALIDNNCEQFARYVTQGTKTSRQLHAAAAITGLALIIWLAEDK